VQTPVWIWQDDADTSVLPTMAEELAGKLPHCSFSLLPGEGHFLPFTHWREILQALVETTTG
jgi:pimeloyl-ACP methyl ester carboxylesterase